MNEVQNHLVLADKALETVTVSGGDVFALAAARQHMKAAFDLLKAAENGSSEETEEVKDTDGG